MFRTHFDRLDSLRPAALVALAGAGLIAGCQTQPVRVVTDPPGATISVRQVSPQRRDLGLSGVTSPATVSLPATAEGGQVYEITATAPQFRPATVTRRVGPGAPTTERLTLAREFADSTALGFRPRYAGRVYAMVPDNEPTVAYVLAADADGTVDPASVEASADATAVTSNRSMDVDYPSIAASPTGDALLYQRVERRPLPVRTVAIPPRSSATLSSIAAENGVTVASLRRSNPDFTEGVDDDQARFGGKILHVDRTEQASEIYKHPLPGGPPSRVTRDAAIELTPAFTGFGDEAVFASDANSENATLWRTSLERGSRLTRLTRGDALDYGPSVGRDYAAYTSVPPIPPGPGAGDVDAPEQVWTARLDREETSKLADGSHARISPDDRQVAYLARPSRGGSRGLYVIDAAGSAPEKLFAPGDVDVRDPAWSPDGRYLAFAADYQTPAERQAGAAQNWNLYVVPVDGSSPPRRVTSNASFDAAPAFDRSGRSLYFRSNRGGPWNVWRIDVDPAALFAPPADAVPEGRAVRTSDAAE